MIFNNEYYREIAKKAYDDKSGIRSLNEHLFNSISSVLENISENVNLGKSELKDICINELIGNNNEIKENKLKIVK